MGGAGDCLEEGRAVETLDEPEPGDVETVTVDAFGKTESGAGRRAVCATSSRRLSSLELSVKRTSLTVATERDTDFKSPAEGFSAGQPGSIRPLVNGSRSGARGITCGLTEAT